MKNQVEVKFLSQLNKSIVNEATQMKRSKIIRFIILTVCWISLVSVIVLLRIEILSGIICVTIAAFIGLIVGHTMRASEAVKQWPFLKQHINIESIQKRLKEIET